MELGGARVRSTLILERAVRAAVVERRGLTFDSRFAAAMPGRSERVGNALLVMSGRVVIGSATYAAPVAFVVADDELERVSARAGGFRIDGAAADSIELRVRDRSLLAPIGLAAGPVALPEACWAAAARVRTTPHDPAALSALLDALAAAVMVAANLARTPVGTEPERFARLWSAFAPLYSDHAAATSLKQVAVKLGISMRQVSRDTHDLAATFALAGGYRDMLRVLRLRLATLMLSSPAPVADVARRIGYSSTIAMARAFRDAALPSPSAIQATLRADDRATP
jgi:AraC-like DNA-binding protein